MAKIIELIITEERRGSGDGRNDIHRLAVQLFTKDGKKVAEFDPCSLGEPNTPDSYFDPRNI
jgi:hypothetical protein